MAHSLGFYDDRISFQIVFSQSLWLRVLPGGAHLVQPIWMPVRRILGGSWTCGISFWPFLNSSGWWWLISSVFLTRISCPKTTHTNGYYGAWPGWAVSVSVLPLTVLLNIRHHSAKNIIPKINNEVPNLYNHSIILAIIQNKHRLEWATTTEHIVMLPLDFITWDHSFFTNFIYNHFLYLSSNTGNF